MNTRDYVQACSWQKLLTIAKQKNSVGIEAKKEKKYRESRLTHLQHHGYDLKCIQH